MSLIKLSLRYTVSNKGSTLLVSFIALAGVTISITAILLTMSVFAGFQIALKEKILSSTPHVIVKFLYAGVDQNYEEALKDSRILYYYPVAVYQGIISNGNSFQSVVVKGINLKDMKYKENYLVEGESKGNLLGRGLADILGVSVNQDVLLISPVGRVTPFGFLPKTTQIKIDGILKTGSFDQDYMTLIMPMEEAQNFFGNNWQLYGLEIFLRDPYKAKEVSKDLENRLGSYAIVRSWIDLNEPLFNALEIEKVGIFFVLLLMVTTASFNITSLLFMKSKEKVRDIAILRTFGMSEKQVFSLFVLQGLILGIAGVVIGLVLAYVGAYMINEYKLVRVPSDVYLMDHIPAHLEAKDIAYTVLGGLMLSLMASLLPAYRASKASVIDILKNE